MSLNLEIERQWAWNNQTTGLKLRLAPTRSSLSIIDLNEFPPLLENMTKQIFAWGLAAVLLPGIAIAQPLDRAAPLAFKGRYLVSISDADMLASAYVDGRLGPREGRDALSVIPLRDHARELRAYETAASNSVAGPPTAVTVSPDGRYACEFRKLWPQDQIVFPEIMAGNTHILLA